MLDLSEQCGYTIAQQAALFHSISPLFASKPLLVVANKVGGFVVHAPLQRRWLGDGQSHGKRARQSRGEQDGTATLLSCAVQLLAHRPFSGGTPLSAKGSV